MTDPERMEAVLDDPYILIANSKVSTVKDLLPLLEKVMSIKQGDVLVAELDKEQSKLKFSFKERTPKEKSQA